MNRITPSSRHRRGLLSRALPLSIGGLMALTSFGQDAVRMDKLESENRDLKARLDALESLAKKEGVLPSGGATSPVQGLSEITLSGFASASYTYDFNNPKDRHSDGYLWNSRANQFSINKVKVTLASKPVEQSGDKWDAGFKASLIFGEDAWAVNTGHEQQGFEALREAYAEFNVPIGTGLDVKVGQLISLLNYESGDGGAVNNNLSQGYQWYYTGNGPAAGVQLSYTFTDWLSANVRVQNGMFQGATDNNNAKTVIGSLNFKPTKDIWFNLIGFGGSEWSGTELKGGSVLAGAQFGNLNLGFEGDYFSYKTAGAGTGDNWSAGTWASYAFDPKFNVALRAEFLQDSDKSPFSSFKGTPFFSPDSQFANASPETHGNIGSIALAFNYKPVPSLKIQPEIRYDQTSYDGGLDGKDSRVIVGVGVHYSF